MEKIEVSLKNHSFLKVKCDKSLAKTLNETFAFYVPNYKHMPAYKNTPWDGRKKLFNMVDNSLPAGLFQKLELFCDHFDIKMDIKETPKGVPNYENDIDMKGLFDFVKGLNPHSNGKPITIRDYQFRGLYEMVKYRRRFFLSPTGSGKSFMYYCMIRYILENSNGKILLVVPTTHLVEQMYNDFADYSSHDSTFNVNENCHKIYSGKEKTNLIERVFISTWQSASKLNKTWFRQFDAVIGDEGHLFQASALSKILEASENAVYRISATGSLSGSKVHEMVLEGLFGPIIRLAKTHKLQERGELEKLNIIRVILEYPQDIKKAFKKQKYHDEIKFLNSFEKRNVFLVNLLKSLDNNSLILFNNIESHGKKIFDIMQDKIRDRRTFFVAGEVATEDREAIRKLIDGLKKSSTAASYGTFSTGVNIKNLHNIIFGAPSKSIIRILQSIGRGLRLSENEVATTLFDIVDDLRNGKNVNYAWKHANIRNDLYKSEKFNVKTIRIKL